MSAPIEAEWPAEAAGTGWVWEELKILPKADATRDEAAHAIAVIKTFSATNELPTYEQLAGNYFDATSGRATLEATAQEDGLLINVNWANSAFENVEWTMLAKYGENDVLAYENCTRKLIGSDEKGNESEKVERYWIKRQSLLEFHSLEQWN